MNNKVSDSPESFYPMWDFDNTELEKVLASLRKTQIDFFLSHIYVIESSPEHFHAICFSALKWQTLINVMTATEHLDQIFFSLGIARHFFTLRVTPRGKHQARPSCVAILKSPIPESEFIKSEAKKHAIDYITRVK